MKDWVLSEEGDKWSVKFDVRDLGSHLDTTFRGRSAVLASRVRLVIARSVPIFALHLDFHGRVRVVRSMYLSAALHGIEASLLASDSLRKLRSSIHSVVSSHRQPLAIVGAVLSLTDGPTGCYPAFCVVWFRFRLLRRYLALWTSQFVVLIVFLRWLVKVALIMVLSISSLLVLLRWDKVLAIGPSYPIPRCDLAAVWGLGIGEFHGVVSDLHRRLNDFIHAVVVHRRDDAIRWWRNWIRREDPLVHPYKWLCPDLVPPALFLQCQPHLTPGPALMKNSERLGSPMFAVSLPRLTGQMLSYVVQRKCASAGSLDGWGWRELKVLPVSWYDGLARVLSKVEDFGVWPDGLLDAYIAMIPKTDGDDTAFTVLPVIYCVWASATMGHLEVSVLGT